MGISGSNKSGEFDQLIVLLLVVKGNQNIQSWSVLIFQLVIREI